MKQNNTTDLSGYSFNNIYYINGPTMPTNVNNAVFLFGFPGFPIGNPAFFRHGQVLVCRSIGWTPRPNLRADDHQNYLILSAESHGRKNLEKLDFVAYVAFL